MEKQAGKDQNVGFGGLSRSFLHSGSPQIMLIIPIPVMRRPAVDVGPLRELWNLGEVPQRVHKRNTSRAVLKNRELPNQ